MTIEYKDPVFSLEHYNLTTEDMAHKLGYNVAYVRQLAKAGKLPAIKRGRQWMFCAEEVLHHFQDAALAAVKSKEDSSVNSESSDLLR